MTKIDANTEFYEQDEKINLPPAMKLVRMEGASYIYGYGQHGRTVSWEFHPALNRWGWGVQKVVLEECCGV